MRLRLAAPVMAGGLILGWAALAQTAVAAPPPPASAPPAATPPPAAPIFYCPTPPARAVATHGGAGRASLRHAVRHEGGQACPTERLAHGETHHWRRHDHEEMRLASRGDEDVSASQAFIYRYERAMHGLNPRAANEAWATGPNYAPPPAPPPPVLAEGAVDHHDHWRDHVEKHHWAEENHGAPMGPPVRDDHAADHAARDLAQGPAEHHEHWREHREDQQWADDGHGGPMGPPVRDDHAADHADHDMAQGAPEDRDHWREHAQDQQWADDGRGDRMAPPVRDDHADDHVARGAEDGGHYGYLDESREGESVQVDRRVERQESEQSWSSESRQSNGWTDRDGDAGEHQWRDGSYGEVVQYAGRDAYGYLVWPGKTPQADTDQGQ